MQEKQSLKIKVNYYLFSYNYVYHYSDYTGTGIPAGVGSPIVVVDNILYWWGTIIDCSLDNEANILIVQIDNIQAVLQYIVSKLANFYFC